jgi:GT2 family glycosyltransferase
MESSVDYVQFVDGDCEVVGGWLEQAKDYLDQHPMVAVVCGRRRERHPEASIYNRLCDWEWDTPVGETNACGGDALMRRVAFEAVGGYRAGLIAGEEPELCLRLRRQGWRIWRLGAEMTRHDAAMTRFSQWWRRSVRAGHAYAEGAWLHGRGPERYWLRDTLSALVWGLGLPLLVLSMLWLCGICALGLVSLFTLQLVRLTLKGDRGWPEDAERALFLLLGKFAEAAGVVRFLGSLWSGKGSGLIEYKS